MKKRLCSLLLFTAAGAYARAETLIKDAIDDTRRVVVRGSTHPLARAEFDRGAAPATLAMERIQLRLKRTAEQESTLERLMAEQQDPASPNYHRWITPEEFGQQFGPSDEDVHTVVGWLASRGFTVNRVANGRLTIDFSGTAAQVEAAFHTPIHQFVVNGAAHWANAKDVEIPEALAPVVAGVVSLHNFVKRPQLIRRAQPLLAKAAASGTTRPQLTFSDNAYALSPEDYWVIYNINPLLNNGINGAGVAIGVVARSNINVQDVKDFQSTFTLVTNPPQIIVNGTNPGDLGGDEESEAVLDTEWSGANAPNATVKLVVSKSTNASDGTDLSEEYIIDNNLADVMTESFGDCEADYSSDDATFYSGLAQQAASEGITYFVASGDAGSAECDDPTETSATGPLSVNLLAATPYSIGVGGTMFNEHGDNGEYWSPNTVNNETALSYIPEDTWNESCTVAQCGKSNAGLWASGGGASTFYSKPSWQSGVTGIPNDGARDVPDIALTAASHDPYLICIDKGCEANNQGEYTLQEISGTSASTPSFAGIMALVVQSTHSRQGQATSVLYKLAAQEDFYKCLASATATAPASSCVFNDVTLGNNAVVGEASYGTSNPTYPATLGYDLTTGLGSVNVANLVNLWNGPPVLGDPMLAFSGVSAGADGTLWALNSSGQIYSYGSGSWQLIPGSLAHIAVGANGDIWGLNSAGDIYRYEAAGNTWEQVPGQLSSIAVGADGSVWGLNSAGSIYTFNSARETWLQIPGALTQIAVGFDGAVWGLNSGGLIFRYNPGTGMFQQVAGALAQIAVGGDGDVWGLNSGGAIYHFNPLAQTWNEIPGALAQIAVGAGNIVFGANAAGNVYQYVSQAQSWKELNLEGTAVAAAANGMVLVLNTEGQVQQVQAAQAGVGTFHGAPGALAQIAVAPDGQVWGLNAQGSVFHFDTGLASWDGPSGALQQIAVGYGGVVWGLNNQKIYRYNPATQSWNNVSGDLTKIAVGGNGSVWGINGAGQVFEYNAGDQTWQEISGASLTEIAVGADGSVWGINTSAQLVSYNAQTQVWSVIPSNVSQLSVGSASNVWAVDGSGTPYYLSSGSLTPVAGTVVEISAAFDGTVWATDSSGFIYRFNAQSQSWVQVSGELKTVTVGADAAIWGLNSQDSIYYYR